MAKKENFFIDFKERGKRKVSPTDIDGFIDYGGNAFIYFE